MSTTPGEFRQARQSCFFNATKIEDLLPNPFPGLTREGHERRDPTPRHDQVSHTVAIDINGWRQKVRLRLTSPPRRDFLLVPAPVDLIVRWLAVLAEIRILHVQNDCVRLDTL